jgi:undecaprenyl-diphosphatase
VAQELHRLLKAHAANPDTQLGSLLVPGLLGMVLSFGAGLLALKWLSSWLSQGRWKFFGLYCLAFALFIWIWGA